MGSIKAGGGVALRVNNGLISPQSEQSVCLPPSGIHQAGSPSLLHSSLTGVSSNELKHSIRQQGREDSQSSLICSGLLWFLLIYSYFVLRPALLSYERYR